MKGSIKEKKQGTATLSLSLSFIVALALRSTNIVLLLSVIRLDLNSSILLH
jgi:hypothetical protein